MFLMHTHMDTHTHTWTHTHTHARTLIELLKYAKLNLTDLCNLHICNEVIYIYIYNMFIPSGSLVVMVTLKGKGKTYPYGLFLVSVEPIACHLCKQL